MLPDGRLDRCAVAPASACHPASGEAPGGTSTGCNLTNFGCLANFVKPCGPQLQGPLVAAHVHLQ